MSKLPLRQYWDFYWNAQTIYSAHSPFVYTFMKDVMSTQIPSKDIRNIETARKNLLRNKDSIDFLEYGAGPSHGTTANRRRIHKVARHSLSGSWQCRIMHEMIRNYKLHNILELGTSLGISTAYLATAHDSANVVTLEGNPSSLCVAKGVWKQLNIDNVDARVGEFDKTLGIALHDLETIDFAFLDGNHRKLATIDYFHQVRGKCHRRSIVIVDDIYWSKGMHEAWLEIIHHKSVAFSIDLFRMGILFFDHSIMPKQHFKLISYRYKPWAIGVFG